jgi:hypothetical protein
LTTGGTYAWPRKERQGQNRLPGFILYDHHQGRIVASLRISHPHKSFCRRCGGNVRAFGAVNQHQTIVPTSPATIKQTSTIFTFSVEKPGRRKHKEKPSATGSFGSLPRDDEKEVTPSRDLS